MIESTTRNDLTPARAIRAHCLACCGDVARGEDGPLGCNSPVCSLYAFRLGSPARLPEAHRAKLAKRQPDELRPLDMPHLARMKEQATRGSRLKAIRLRCLDCAGGPAAVRECVMPACRLYAYRFGRRPTTGAGRPKVREGQAATLAATPH